MAFRFVQPGTSHLVAESGPLIQHSIGVEYDRAEQEAGSAVFVISKWQGVHFTYRQVGRMSRALAIGLLKMGLKAGDRVGIWLSNRWEYVVAQMGTAMAGLVLVTINPAYRSQELHHAAKLVGLRVLILQPTLKTSQYHDILAEAGNIPSLQYVIEVGDAVREGSISFNKILRDNERANFAPLRQLKVNANEPVNIQFTSGTTGHPKGSTLSHRNLLNNAYAFGARLGMTSKDVLVVPLPLYHTFGCVLGVLLSMVHRSCIVLPSESFDPVSCLDAISQFKGTVLYGVPTMHLAVHTEFTSAPAGKWNVSSLRGGAMGGSPCPPVLMRKMMDDLGMKDFACAYGMTETSPVSLSTNLSDSVDLRCNTVGTIMPNLELKIVDEHRKVVPVGIAGELLVKGYSVMLGYWNQEDKTREAIVDGFMLTGDLATVDAHGYFRIVGRSKDMIIRGGENIFPAEVENFLLKMPGVMDVAVVGVPSERLGEEVCAWIRPKDPSKHPISKETVHAFCKGRIAHHNIPQFVLCIDEFPMTVTGKVRKNILREMAQERLLGFPKAKL